MESEALKTPSFEKVRSSESDGMGIVKTGSLTKVEEVNGGQNVYGLDPSIEFIDGKEVCPATPSTDRESLDLPCSPDRSEDQETFSGSQTPKEHIFDPFAPLPQELLFAPKKKTPEGTHIPLRRQLNFDDCGDLGQIKDNVRDDELSELVYQSFLELIVSSQLHGISAHKKSDPYKNSDHLNTPVSAAFLTGIAETCPPAPKRQPAKSRKCNPGVCRKLDFSGSLT
ncbi:uncharacterized protein LOC122007820 [Zingiber officinale]|uniref:Uncharacterized protein n=1 Tax=Zingiber officinale TaxID=94328 RepID=A0A8J5KQN7_ZINOF|nr:uncharacterized protein LOC122007820 [Zingiber officinale]KAG6485420.1 hypothetical protein ZIOFF_053958 [Zingiber officinale]